jgi:hypothetical protein
VIFNSEMFEHARFESEVPGVKQGDIDAFSHSPPEQEHDGTRTVVSLVECYGSPLHLVFGIEYELSHVGLQVGEPEKEQTFGGWAAINRAVVPGVVRDMKATLAHPGQPFQMIYKVMR